MRPAQVRVEGGVTGHFGDGGARRHHALREPAALLQQGEEIFVRVHIRGIRLDCAPEAGLRLSELAQLVVQRAEEEQVHIEFRDADGKLRRSTLKKSK